MLTRRHTMTMSLPICHGLVFVHAARERVTVCSLRCDPALRRFAHWVVTACRSNEAGVVAHAPTLWMYGFACSVLSGSLRAKGRKRESSKLSKTRKLPLSFLLLFQRQSVTCPSASVGLYCVALRRTQAHGHMQWSGTMPQCKWCRGMSLGARHSHVEGLNVAKDERHRR